MARRRRDGFTVASMSGVAGVGAFAGLLLIFVDAPFPADRVPFFETTEFGVWAALVAVTTAIWALVTVVVAASLRLVVHRRAVRWREILPSLLVFSALLLAVVCTSSAGVHRILVESLPYLSAKMFVLGLGGWVIAVVSAFGVLTVDGALRDVPRASPRNGDISEFLELRRLFHRFVVAQSVVFASGFAVAASLRNAISANNITPYAWPQGPFLVYGLALSGLLALLYVPTYGRLFRTARHLRDAYFPLASPNADSWLQWAEAREKLETLLGVQTVATAGLRLAAAVLTPALTAAAALLLGLTH